MPRFELYNLAGQRVRALGRGTEQAGEYQIHWDPTDWAGNRIPPASYILQMKTEEFVARTPVVVIR